MVQFPTGPIEFVVPFSTGGAVDRLMRKLATIEQKERIFGQPIQVTNRPGGGTQIGMNYLAQQSGNPHFLASNTPTGVLTPIREGSGVFLFKDVTPVARLQLDDYAIFVRDDSPYQGIQDLIADLRSKADQISVGGTVTGSPSEVIWRQLELDQDLKISYVPFDSQGDALTALLGGHISAMTGSLSSAVGPQVKAGKVRMLAAAASTRAASMPDVPNLKEQGINVAWSQWRGVFAPPNLDPLVVEKLVSLVRELEQTDEYQQYLKDSGLTPGFLGGDEFKAFLEEEHAFFSEMLPKLGL